MQDSTLFRVVSFIYVSLVSCAVEWPSVDFHDLDRWIHQMTSNVCS